MNISNLTSTNEATEKLILNNLRDIPDFPKPGIIFKDITPILSDSRIFNQVIDGLIKIIEPLEIDCIAGIEARGFLFGTPLSSKLNLPFVPIRKPGKLPWKKKSVSYTLEYGEATIEVHEDALEFAKKKNLSGPVKVAVIDDPLATGGTTHASCKLIEAIGGQVVVAAFVIELGFLPGRKVLEEITSVKTLATVN